jgi:hypothetical protein
LTTSPEPTTDQFLFDLVGLESELAHLHKVYMEADPFPHIVIDNFLEPGTAEAAAGEFPPIEANEWTNYLHVNERKFSHTDPSTWGPTLRQILAELNSPRFVAFVGGLIGIENLLVDPTLEGGGLHQSTTGGFLNMHADFTVHPHIRQWQRRANLLLYLNPGWKTEYGGDLELWSRDMTHCVEKVSPIANRLLIFTTDDTSFHGHPEPMRCPNGVARRSLALYYFTKEDAPLARSTEYRARPGEGARSVFIYGDKQLLRAYDWAKRHIGISDRIASRVLGYRARVRRKKL